MRSIRMASTGENATGAATTSMGKLVVTLEIGEGVLVFDWSGDREMKRCKGRLSPAAAVRHGAIAFDFQFEPAGIAPLDWCWAHASSVHAMFRRIRQEAPVVESIEIGVVPDEAIGPAAGGAWHQLVVLPAESGWKWLGRMIADLGKAIAPMMLHVTDPAEEAAVARLGLQLVTAAQLGVPPSARVLTQIRKAQPLDLRITFDRVEGRIEWVWAEPDSHEIRATGSIITTGFRQLKWRLQAGDDPETADISSLAPDAIRKQLDRWLTQFELDASQLTILWRFLPANATKPTYEQEPPFVRGDDPRGFIVTSIVNAMEEWLFRHSPLGRVVAQSQEQDRASFAAYAERQRRREEKKHLETAKRRAAMAELAEQKRKRDEARDKERAAAEAKKAAEARAKALLPARPAPKPLPPVPVVVRVPELAIQESTFPLADLRDFALRESAALWWVSNQSDDLLCLPYCRIQRLEYQFRTALRVLGPLRGRALLSDEVGLGKTIEAGLIAKELFTRGLVKRMLVLTLPSLVDQWAEELEEKFGITAATTNQAGRTDAGSFWSENAIIVASLHTVKQPAQLTAASQVHWDMLVVDEAHHLRNRTSQAWQAVNALPRQFLLLLTATPVQNSLEELYNLVTLLQPGQLPSPKEFRARFIDPQRPRQPREPEELRRLLGQVMIRNTRANAGIILPPRHAETVMLAPTPQSAEFWQTWEQEFRLRLGELSAGQASLWGRLVLQALGSSPSAWRAVLTRFPAADAANAWRGNPAPDDGWRRKCGLLLPLVRDGSGAVVFTQFLDTQAAVAEFLREAGVPVVAINGATPAAERQPLTEEFHRRGGALLLTQSGTEGRNLQFCHTLVNFDLPWNPMEIEQRIGRLHRLGQRNPVRIFNFVEQGTLQEHLLQVLQEKLNLFELVVGETGLVLGDQYSGDEFETEVFERWRDANGDVAAAIAGLGEELARARDRYGEVRQLDETLFAEDFESR